MADKKPKTKHFTFRCPYELAEILEAKADEAGKQLTEVLVELLSQTADLDVTPSLEKQFESMRSEFLALQNKVEALEVKYSG